MEAALVRGLAHEERWSPWFLPAIFWLPCMWRYEVVIADGRLRFGYGPSFHLMRKEVLLANVGAVEVGSSTWKENLLQFGGWGIRYGMGGIWNYNAANGPWVQFTCKDSGRQYRFATRNQAQVAELLRDA
jgi:hypothetical protein